jgi:hypothetical protein
MGPGPSIARKLFLLTLAELLMPPLLDSLKTPLLEEIAISE